MELFRITRKQYSNSVEASGMVARWNLNGQYVVYTGATRSLSTLELLVNRKNINLAGEYTCMVITATDNAHLVQQIRMTDLPDNWRSRKALSVLQQIGTEWYNSRKSLFLKVPSAVIPAEYNFLINTRHPDFPENISLIRTEPYFWDKRLF
ncbi:MAG: RES family NAD+ phosphorylase [Bacteroidota bacterium]